MNENSWGNKGETIFEWAKEKKRSNNCESGTGQLKDNRVK
jgi:hypothetical protein